MWSDRKPQENPALSRGQSRPEPRAPSESLESQARGAAVESRAGAVVGRGMVIKGQVRSGEHMHVAGEIDGSLSLPGFDLMVTADARIRADVTAREVEIAGSIQGNVDATRKITVRKGGMLIGDLRTPGIVIEDGAYFKGNIEIVTREPQRQPEETTPVTAQTASPAVHTAGAKA